MKQSAIATAIIGLLAVHSAARGGEPPTGATCATCNSGYSCNPWGAVMPGSRPTFRPLLSLSYAGDDTCDSCGMNGRRGDRLHQLCDFLFYRPTIPCDWRPHPSEWEPRLYAGFPNVCNATPGCGNGCGHCGGFAGNRGGCASCAATLGKPTSAGQAKSTAYSFRSPGYVSPVASTSMNQKGQFTLQSSARYPQPELLPSALQQSQPSPYAPVPTLPQR